MMKSIPELFSRLQSHTQLNTARQAAKPPVPNLDLVLFIVDWAVFNLVFSAFEEKNVIFHYINRGRGTATSETLDLLGIGASDKAVIACLEQPAKIPALVKEVRKKLASQGQSRGIAFTMRLSAINSPLLRAFGQPEPATDDNKESTGRASNHFLIYSVINRGYAEEFMDTAREAGARGGTVLSARYQASGGAVKFFGISVQEEREVILMLTGADKKETILQSVSSAHGLDSKTQGLIFSLPVDKVMSLSFEQEFNT